MQRKHFSLTLAAACAALFAGCEWTSSSGDSSWSGSYDAMNFGGTYRITTVTQTGDSGEGDVQPVQTKSFGSTQAGVYKYSGTVKTALVEGSVSILFGNVGSFVPNGTSQSLKGVSINGTATVNYKTGDWEVVLDQNVGSGLQISVQYQAAAGSSGSSYTGIDTSNFDPKYVSSITVSQTGQYLTMSLNNGVTMSGRFTSVRQTAAVSEDTGAGANTYNAQFEVSGGNSKMVGTLNYDYPTHNRMLDGTWTYGRKVFDVHAIGPAWTESGVTTGNESSSN